MRKVPKTVKKGYGQSVPSQIHADRDIKKIFVARNIWKYAFDRYNNYGRPSTKIYNRKLVV